MYTRRKVFSIANDYDYDDYYERLYSEAFDDGIDYAIEKYFADNKAIGEGTRYLPAIPADENAIRKNNKKQSEKKFYDKMKEKIVNQWNKYAKNEGKGVNWKNIGNRTAMVAAPAAVLAGLGYGGYKLATRKKEKEYSEGFEDGYDYAVQRLFADGVTADVASRNTKLSAFIPHAKPKGVNNSLQESIDDAWENYSRDIKDQAQTKRTLNNMKNSSGSLEDYYANLADEADYNSMKEAEARAKKEAAEKAKREAEARAKKEAAALAEHNAALPGIQQRFLDQAQANAKYYEDLYKKGQITKAELEKQLASSKSTISGLNTRVGNLQGSLDKALKGQDRLSNDLRKSESGRKMVEKSLRNWKIGTGIGAGITAAGIGAYALRNRKKNRD